MGLSATFQSTLKSLFGLPSVINSIKIEWIAILHIDSSKYQNPVTIYEFYEVLFCFFGFHSVGFNLKTFDNHSLLLQNVQASDHHVVKLHEVRQPDAPTHRQDQVDAVERGEAGVPGHREGDEDGLLGLPLEAIVNLEGCAG